MKSIFGVLNTIKKEKIKYAIKDTLIYAFFAITILSVVFWTDSVIVREYEYPKILILTFGFQFAKMFGILQLSHILECPYNIYTPVFLIPLFVLTAYSIIYNFTGYSLFVSIDILI